MTLGAPEAPLRPAHTAVQDTPTEGIPQHLELPEALLGLSKLPLLLHTVEPRARWLEHVEAHDVVQGLGVEEDSVTSYPLLCHEEVVEVSQVVRCLALPELLPGSPIHIWGRERNRVWRLQRPEDGGQ